MLKIRDIMKSSVLTVGPDADIQQVVRILADKNITGLPVVEDDKLLGIVSEKDILRLLYDFEENSASISSYMTPDPCTCNVDDDISVAVRLLSGNNFRRIPVMQDQKLAGIVSRKDILKHIYDSFALQGV